MRAFCTVSAPLEVCASSAEQLSPGSRFLALRLLGNQQPKTLYYLVDAKSRVREVYTQTCLYFAKEGMLDTDLFGLAVLIDGEYLFADPESKLSKYGPKSWRSSHTHGLDANGRPLLELHFRVQFYVESPFMLKDDCSKHNYYLQLRYNALQQDIPREYSEQSIILLAGLALQAELGDAPMPPSKNKKSKAITTPVTAVTKTTKVHEKILVNTVNDKSKLKTVTTNATSTEAASTSAPSALPTTAKKSPNLTTKVSKRKSNNNNSRAVSLTSYAPSAAAAAEQASTSAAAAAANSASSSNLKRLLNATLPSSKEISVAPSTSSCSSSSARSVPDLTPETEYFRVEDYLPEGLRSAWAISALRACHRENRGMSTADAELHYIQQACLVHENINAHTYRLRVSKQEVGPGSCWFIVYAKGIKIIQMLPQPAQTQKELLQQFVRNQAPTPTQTTTFLWPNITKLSFERKKFEVRSGDSKVTLYANSDEKNKMLLTLCKETHQFSMKLAARIKEVIKRDEEESNCLHACYVYSRSLHMLYKSKNDQRISVISSTSSNTTSGIVSDRVHSEDELEIMINTPPAPVAAPSTESLALAHLLDRPSVSRQTSSVGQVSLKDLEEQLAALSVRQAQQQLSNNNSGVESPTSNASAGNSSSSQSGGSLPTSSSQHATNCSNATDSPSSQHNIGSQCSSTCSTVVVAATTNAENSLCAQRRNSTSSSLELGFSHTAQNSTLSEAGSNCIDHDSESVSGVYTLAHGAPVTETSGVYTMNSSELTGQNSEMAESEKSSHYGVRPVSSKSAAEEFRLRCNSNVSTNGSFRGDGSDPQDSAHMLLSAKELTELIVGCGTYPTRQAPAATLDTDCDYVTLPLPTEMLPVEPPAPPQRIDSNACYSPLNKQRLPAPPPYNARHEKTGLCGPPISQVSQVPLPAATAKSVTNAGSVLRRRDPPPYAKALKQRPSSLLCAGKAVPVEHAALSTRHSLNCVPRATEEVPARIITSRPQINILKAHTSLVNENAKPSYAAPTNSSASVNQHYASHLSQNSNYVSGSQASSTRQLSSHRAQVPLVPYLPYNLHAPHKSMSALHAQAPPPPPPYADIKQACVLLPVIKSQQYLPPPPPSMPRQPPPPPPYGKQMELYQQQLYSDVDYVIYPIQDPAVSQQEYLDAKQGSILAAMAAQNSQPHSYLAAYHHHHAAWDSCKTHAIYRSTPYLPLALSHAHSRYASTQNLSDTYVQLPTACSPIYSPSLASLCSSFEPPPPPPLHPAALHSNASYFVRSRSDDNILNSLDALPKMKRLPPPPPPPYVNRRLKKPPMPTPSEKPPPIPSKPATILRHQMPTRKPPTLSTTRSGHTHMTKTSSGAHWAGERPKPEHSFCSRGSTSLLAQLQASVAATAHTRHKHAEQLLSGSTASATSNAASSTANALDIALLREKSRNLDLPLISALCNDRSLLKQTKVLINSNNKSVVGATTTTTTTTMATATNAATSNSNDMTTTTTAANATTATTTSNNLDNNNVTTTGASTTTIAATTTTTATTTSIKLHSSSKSRKISNISHRHPNDKLPPLPMQLAEANNYVMDPAVLKQQHQKNNNNNNSNNNSSSIN